MCVKYLMCVSLVWTTNMSSLIQYHCILTDFSKMYRKSVIGSEPAWPSYSQTMQVRQFVGCRGRNLKRGVPHTIAFFRSEDEADNIGSHFWHHQAPRGQQTAHDNAFLDYCESPVVGLLSSTNVESSRMHKSPSPVLECLASFTREINSYVCYASHKTGHREGKRFFLQSDRQNTTKRHSNGNGGIQTWR